MNEGPPVEPGATADSRAAFRKLRLLVADDNRDTVLTLMLLLREDGHDVHGAYRGTDVVRMVRLYTFDAVICDIEMPEMSGYAIAQELRTHFYPRRPPLLIAISGKWNRPSEKLLAQAAGFDHHLEKPCDPNLLLRVLRPLTLPSADGVANRQDPRG